VASFSGSPCTLPCQPLDCTSQKKLLVLQTAQWLPCENFRISSETSKKRTVAYALSSQKSWWRHSHVTGHGNSTASM